MTNAILQFGTERDVELRAYAVDVTKTTETITVVPELLSRLGHLQQNTQSMLRTTAALFATYLNKTPDELSLDAVYDYKSGFAEFLRSRKYKKNSVRSYVNYSRILLSQARNLGWSPDASVPDVWRSVIAQSSSRKCRDLARAMCRIRQAPRQVTIEDVDTWMKNKLADGYAFYELRRKKMRFWRLLRDTDCTEQTPLCLVRERHYGIPVDEFPLSLKKEVKELLRWKQAPFSIDRPKGERLRPVSAKVLRDALSCLYGFAVNVQGVSGIETMSELIQKPLAGAYVEWGLNERRVKGKTIARRLGSIGAALRHHPSHRSLDLSWLKALIDSIPVDPESEARRRKAEKFLEYSVAEMIPERIRTGRAKAAEEGSRYLARVVMEELLMRWIVVLPWRQRNIRECRIGGSNPNLFKAKIPAFSELDRPKWIREAEKNAPEMTFWQFRFSPDETKMKREVHAFVPRQLIDLLEEYLREFRQNLIPGADPGTLFINPSGGAMNEEQVTSIVGQLALKHAGIRVTPHIFRDIVAFGWLKEHPEHYLTLSKLLWHSNIDTTIKKYGSRFNESSGACAMEAWLDEREAKSE